MKNKSAIITFFNKIILYLFKNICLDSSNFSNETNLISLKQQAQITRARPHGDICEIFPNIFFLTETNKIHHGGVNIQTSRNMVILRNDSELTLINTVTFASDFCRLLETLSFRHLLSAHGEPLINKAYEKITKTVKRVFPK